MPKRIGNVTRDLLVKASLPAATETYTVISHGYVINTIMQSLEDNGFTVKDELYKATTNNAQVASGVFRLEYGDDPDMGMMFAFANSYDKSLKFRCAVGGYVYANEGSIISHKTNQWGRKHTGTADEETAEVIINQIENAASYFETLVETKEVMKNIELTENDYAKLLGVLYFEKKLLSGEQLGIIRREYAKPSYTYTTTSDSLWTLYNHILVSLKKCHPRLWFDQQRLIHFHMVTEYDLANFDPQEAPQY